MQSTALSVARLIGYVAAAFFAVLALALAVTGVWVAFFFRDSGSWDPSFLQAGLILLLYAAVFAAAARLATRRVPSPARGSHWRWRPSPVSRWQRSGAFSPETLGERGRARSLADPPLRGGVYRSRAAQAHPIGPLRIEVGK